MFLPPVDSLCLLLLWVNVVIFLHLAKVSPWKRHYREGEGGGVCNIVLWGPQKCSVCVSSSANISIILASYFAIRLCNDIQVISQRQYLLPVSHVVVCTYFYGTVLAKTFFSSFIFTLAVLLFFTAPTEPVQTGLI